jgi:tRNA pseudouridine38-40 synthase
MPRFKITIEYDGSGFAGWQTQPDIPTVQGALTGALTVINGAPVLVQGAGRTDAGVHAVAQVAHVDLIKDWTPFTLRNAINGNMKGHRISVTLVEPVADDFNARFSATRRHYLYRILNRRAPPALERGKVWFVPVDLDVGAMQEAAQILVGHHDFTTFRSSECQAKSPIKTLDLLDVARNGEVIEVRTNARSFLHNQVRSMVGSLKFVGDGNWKAGDIKRALEARSREACGPVAPADGLYLMQVDY